MCEDQLLKGLQQLRPGPGQSLGPGEHVAAQGEELATHHSCLLGDTVASSCVQTSVFLCLEGDWCTQELREVPVFGRSALLIRWCGRSGHGLERQQRCETLPHDLQTPKVSKPFKVQRRPFVLLCFCQKVRPLTNRLNADLMSSVRSRF